MIRNIQNDINLLKLMMDDQNLQDDIYKPSAYWSGYQKRIHNELKKKGLDNFRNEINIGKGFSDLRRTDVEYPSNIKGKIKNNILKLPLIKKMIFDYKSLINSSLEELMFYRNEYFNNNYEEFINEVIKNNNIESFVGGGDELSLRGNRISLKYFINLLRIKNFDMFINFSKVKKVFEIGGGFGSFIHCLLHNNKNIKKILYLDIPPLLYIGTQYLKYFYGKNVISYEITRKYNNIKFKDDNSLEIYCIAPWQLKYVSEKFDLFWNTHSMSEMKIDIVKNYIKYLIKITDRETKFALILNKIENKKNSELTLPNPLINSFKENKINLIEVDKKLYHPNDGIYYTNTY